MKTLFKPIQNKKISEDIIIQFKELILNKELKSGDKIPSERELTEIFSAGRPTIREALRSLEMMDLIEVQPGRGSFVKELNFSSYIETIKDNVNFMLLSEKVSLKELYGGRKLVEPGIARLVAENRTPEDLENLEQLVRDTQNSLDDSGRFIKYSAMFHRELAAMTKNKVIRFTMDFILTLSPRARLQCFSFDEFRKKVAEDHALILNRIREFDGDGASAEMENHLNTLTETCSDKDFMGC